jgi:hypothetical protein
MADGPFSDDRHLVTLAREQPKQIGKYESELISIE